MSALKQEVEQLRTSHDLMRRSHEAIVRENLTLQTKLERLELVFSDEAAGARSPVRPAAPPAATKPQTTVVLPGKPPKEKEPWKD